MKRKKIDRISGVVVLLLGVAILWQGKDLFFGTPRNPGPGFFPSILGAVLIGLSFLLILKGKRYEEEEREKPVSGRPYVRPLAVFLVLLLYSFLLELLGFLIVSFALMMMLFLAIARQRWSVALLGAVISTGLSYLLFDVFLKSNLPKGPMGF